MIDAIFSGLMGGLFGPALAAWMSRFKYRIIFLFVTFATYAYLFLRILISDGPNVALEKLYLYGLEPVVILVSIGIGLLAVLIAFVGSAAVPSKDNESEDPDK